MNDLSDDAARSSAEALIREAFDRARRAGKRDWQQMTTAVLNNRLLQITDGEFSIGQYGVHTVAEFVRLFPNTVRVSEGPNFRPALVSLIDGPEEAADDQNAHVPAREGARLQVREDLWRATMDWNERHTYVVDPVTGRARLRLPTDPAELPSIKGVTEDKYVQWRNEFIDDALARVTEDDDQRALTSWRDAAGPSRKLPSHLQDAWMSRLRTLVTEHIREWFAGTGLPVPQDLTREKSVSRSTPTSAPVEVAVATQRLRELVRRCIDQMSYDELRSLQLPAGVIARIER